MSDQGLELNCPHCGERSPVSPRYLGISRAVLEALIKKWSEQLQSSRGWEVAPYHILDDLRALLAAQESQ